MKGIQLTKDHQLQYGEFPQPELSSGDVLIKILRCGICRTDRKFYASGQQDLILPRIPGHELIGEIVAIGSNVTRYQQGERVIVHPGIFCGLCPDCQAGRDEICPEMKIFGFNIDGGFATYCRIPARGVANGILLKVKPDFPLYLGTFVEPLACAVHMAERLQPQKNDRLLVIGGGALGTLTALLWKQAGVANVTLIEPADAKRKKLRHEGLHAVSTADELASAPTVAIPCCPDPKAFSLALELLEPGGRLGFFSGLTGNFTLSAQSFNRIHYRELTVAGSYGCALQHSRQALQLLSNDFPLPPTFITEYNLEEAVANIQTLEQDETFFSVIVMEDE